MDGMSAFVSSTTFLNGINGSSWVCRTRTDQYRRAQFRFGASRRCRVLAKCDDDDVPEEIKELDRKEAERLAARKADPNPPPRLTDDELNQFFEMFPEVGEFHNRTMHAMRNTKGLDPNEDITYSDIYRLLKARSRYTTLVASVWFSLAAAVVIALLEIRRIFAPKVIASALVAANFYVDAFLHGICGLFLVCWMLSRHSDHSDAPRRLGLSTMAASSLMLASTGLMATTHVVAGLWTGAIARLIALPISLWLWEDLSEELQAMVVFSNIPHAIAFSIWRKLVTIFALCLGGLVRIVALVNPREFPVRDLLVKRAVGIRLLFGRRFPVALSLLLDPGGTAFLSGLVLIVGFVYILITVIFLSDLLSNRRHRKSGSLLSKLLISWNIYLPDELPNIKDLQSTAPEGTKPFFPSPAMMLRRPKDMLAFNSTIANSGLPPILSLLEEEESIMKRKGMDRWSPPIDELIPISDVMNEQERARITRENWARPLTDEEQKSSFGDFFESITDEEDFVYDPSTENWVFNGSFGPEHKASPEATPDAKIDDNRNAKMADDSSARFVDLDDPELGTVV